MQNIFFFAGIFLLTAGTFTHAATYRWVDENGVTVYSQTPPPSGQAQQIKAPPPPSTSPDEARRRLQRQQQFLRDRQEDRELSREKKTKAEEERELRRQNCLNARSNLKNLQINVRRLYKDPEGNYKRLTETERQEMIDTARKQIKENCDK